ncbi:hypothetical protein LTR53_006622 [Teratosphaeriaceae sp. CCFEE 6253]|nr:hypothetical protein LTR53_006622 [Teratosphaeriaceae sp. CCFEE 6253]
MLPRPSKLACAFSVVLMMAKKLGEEARTQDVVALDDATPAISSGIELKNATIVPAVLEMAPLEPSGIDFSLLFALLLAALLVFSAWASSRAVVALTRIAARAVSSAPGTLVAGLSLLARFVWTTYGYHTTIGAFLPLLAEPCGIPPRRLLLAGWLAAAALSLWPMVRDTSGLETLVFRLRGDLAASRSQAAELRLSGTADGLELARLRDVVARTAAQLRGLQSEYATEKQKAEKSEAEARYLAEDLDRATSRYKQAVQEAESTSRGLDRLGSELSEAGKKSRAHDLRANLAERSLAATERQLTQARDAAEYENYVTLSNNFGAVKKTLADKHVELYEANTQLEAASKRAQAIAQQHVVALAEEKQRTTDAVEKSRAIREKLEKVKKSMVDAKAEAQEMRRKVVDQQSLETRIHNGNINATKLELELLTAEKARSKESERVNAAHEKKVREMQEKLDAQVLESNTDAKRAAGIHASEMGIVEESVNTCSNETADGKAKLRDCILEKDAMEILLHEAYQRNPDLSRNAAMIRDLQQKLEAATTDSASTSTSLRARDDELLKANTTIDEARAELLRVQKTHDEAVAGHASSLRARDADLETASSMISDRDGQIAALKQGAESASASSLSQQQMEAAAEAWVAARQEEYATAMGRLDEEARGWKRAEEQVLAQQLADAATRVQSAEAEAQTLRQQTAAQGAQIAALEQAAAFASQPVAEGRAKRQANAQSMGDTTESAPAPAARASTPVSGPSSSSQARPTSPTLTPAGGRWAAREAAVVRVAQTGRIAELEGKIAKAQGEVETGGATTRRIAQERLDYLRPLLSDALAGKA